MLNLLLKYNNFIKNIKDVVCNEIVFKIFIHLIYVNRIIL